MHVVWWQVLAQGGADVYSVATVAVPSSADGVYPAYTASISELGAMASAYEASIAGTSNGTSTYLFSLYSCPIDTIRRLFVVRVK